MDERYTGGAQPQQINDIDLQLS